VEGDGDRFSVTVPARSELVGTIRVFASSVARHHGLDDDAVEDLKLAVSEACTDPIDAGAGGDVTVAIRFEGAELVCEVTSAPWESVERSTDLPEDVDPAVLDRLQLVRALFSDAERSRASDGVTVRFSTVSRTSAG
jgi:histidine kinase-like protein